MRRVARPLLLMRRPLLRRTVIAGASELPPTRLLAVLALVVDF